MNITTKGVTGTGQVFQNEQRVILVHDGARGPSGLQGEQGEKGDPGDSIVMRGPWGLGATYCPLDAVTARSTASEGIYSLFIQKSSVPCSPSTVEPYLDTARWDEVGAANLSNITGSIWEIYQLNHGFEWVGTPVSFSHSAQRWVKADAGPTGDIAVGVVREVIDGDRALLQMTGEVPYIDPRVIWPDGSVWDPGRVYFVSQNRGRVEVVEPADKDSVRQPILIPTRYHQSDLSAVMGVVVPWAPLEGALEPELIAVGRNKFVFTAGAGQSAYTGTDTNGNELLAQPMPDTDVFVNGASWPTNDITVSADGLTVTLAGAPPPTGALVEIWTPDRNLDLVLPSTQAKLDSIAAAFNGVRTVFPLTVNAGTPVATMNTMNALIWLDAIGQEPLVDYVLIDDPANAGFAAIEFNAPPEEATRFWGTVFLPVP